mmetsp:Transcript_29939/g.55043  ORF Transcript_29939/g.55043 Transcript_29939/m.55043 type:complete len:239 (+) Transcript_29939:843-1559(+)
MSLLPQRRGNWLPCRIALTQDQKPMKCRVAYRHIQLRGHVLVCELPDRILPPMGPIDLPRLWFHLVNFCFLIWVVGSRVLGVLFLHQVVLYFPRYHCHSQSRAQICPHRHPHLVPPHAQMYRRHHPSLPPHSHHPHHHHHHLLHPLPPKTLHPHHNPPRFHYHLYSPISKAVLLAAIPHTKNTTRVPAWSILWIVPLHLKRKMFHFRWCSRIFQPCHPSCCFRMLHYPCPPWRSGEWH